MKLLHLWINLFIGLLTPVSMAFIYQPPGQMGLTRHHGFQRAPAKHEVKKATPEVSERLKTVRVVCHPDSLEVVIQADMFGVGAPVNPYDLQLGVVDNEYCEATEYSADEYRIVVGLKDCGTKHLMTEDSLIYTNLLVYSPEPSPDGLIRMDEAAIPIECQYERKYSVSSSSITPHWIPFTSTQSAVETLTFNLKIMTNDWLYERSSKVFHIGNPIRMEASVHVGHHMGLRVFMTGCVATLDPDIYSVPRYVFIENGCLIDSQLPDSRAYFEARRQDDKLQLVIDAFKFNDDDNGQLYITCHLRAAPANNPDSPNKACTFANGRWRSADGNDYLCGQCRGTSDVGHTSGQSGIPGKFGPRGFGKPAEPENQWRSIPRAYTVWEQEARVGPVMVLPAKARSQPIPKEEVPLVLGKISRPSLYGSQWRSGIKKIELKKELDQSQTSADQEQDQSSEDENELDSKEGDTEDEIDVIPAVIMTPAAVAADLDHKGTEDFGKNIPPTLDVMVPSNGTAEKSDFDNTELITDQS